MTRDELLSVGIMIAFFTFLLIATGCRGPQGERGIQGEPGLPGLPGLDGADAVIEMIDPCPAIVAQHPELLLKSGNTFYAVYAQGQKIHLSALLEGVTYSTTDGRACQFRIAAGEVVLD